MKKNVHSTFFLYLNPHPHHILHHFPIPVHPFSCSCPSWWPSSSHQTLNPPLRSSTTHWPVYSATLSFSQHTPYNFPSHSTLPVDYPTPFSTHLLAPQPPSNSSTSLPFPPNLIAQNFFFDSLLSFSTLHSCPNFPSHFPFLFILLTDLPLLLPSLFAHSPPTIPILSLSPLPLTPYIRIFNFQSSLSFILNFSHPTTHIFPLHFPSSLLPLGCFASFHPSTSPTLPLPL